MKALFGTILATALAAQGTERASVPEDLSRWVDPFVGTSATGHTTPAATCPFGMVQPGPDTGNFAWKYCSGYQYADTTLIGFSQTHLSGTGAADLGDVRILPYAGGTNMPATVALDKSSERASPGYYAVNAGGVGVEISASPRVAFYRLRFPAGERARVKIDPATGLVRRDNERLRIPRNVVMQMSKDVIVGDYHRIGWGDREVHWRLKASCPFELVSEMTDNGRHWRIDFPEGTRTVELRIALSATSDAGAERNLAAEGGASFDEARAAADAAWSELFGRLVIDADEATKRIFYTALYHVCFQPNLFSDVGEPERYSTFSYWDTFRAAHPLYTLLVPEKIPAFVESELDQFGRTGHLSSWSLWGRDVQCMIATHSVPPLVDACLKGLVDGGTERRVYEVVKKTLKEKHADREKEDWDILDRFGYYPYDAVRESASRTLECAYDDACAQRLAEKLGEKDDAAFFAKRAGYWRNVFDSKTGFARPRMCDGAWTEPFDPTDNGAYFGFTEANSWQYTWHVMHDIPGLMAAMGGKERFAAKLRELFEQPYRRGRRWTADITGEIGQYAHGNEPSHHIPFLFFLCGQWDAGEKWVRHICETLYRDAPDGLCGNDDCGQISAWYVFAMLGFYPVDPCGGEYVQGMPIVEHRFAKPMTLVPQPRIVKKGIGTVENPGIVEKRDASIPEEGYRLSVSASGVTISSSTAAGAFYARKTLSQLATEVGNTRAYPIVEIEDAPAFPWRGVHIDDSRHFFGRETVKRVLDQMAEHKFNRLHWHLTDDQGWRIDVPGHPELVKYGAVRSQSLRRGVRYRNKDEGKLTAADFDGVRYGPFYYGEEDIKDIVAYAAARHIAVVPEIELPGHVFAALAAYPELACVPGNVSNHDPRLVWGVSKDVLCIGNDKAIKLMEDVLDYVCKVFPGDVVHIGGDECPRDRWKTCPKCQERIRKEGLSGEDELQTWAARHFIEFLEARGKRAIGWAEFLKDGIPPSAMGMSWHSRPPTPGYDVVMATEPFTYLDCAQGLKDDPMQYYGYRPLEKCYDFDPYRGIDAKERVHVLGGECCNWSEYTWNETELDWKMWPRACATAEALWLGEAKPGIDDFRRRLAIHRQRLLAAGVNCATIK